MMAVSAGARSNGALSPSPAEEKELYSQLSRLRDAVITGDHPQFKLPPATIEQLKASLAAINAQTATPQQPAAGGLINGFAFNANAVSTNHAQHASPPTLSNFPGLPGLQNHAGSSKPATLKPSSSGLDPIFLEKSDSLVRAEGQLKRQRIEREFQTQSEQRKPNVDKVAGTAQDPSPLDVDAILLSSSAREAHVSGLKPVPASPASSFDTNDYYSSQVESEWSSPASVSKDSDGAAGAFTADFEHLGEQNASSLAAKSGGRYAADAHNAFSHASKERPAQATYASLGNNHIIDDEEDDDYTPPDAAAFDGFQEENTGIVNGTPPDEDDNSDYEPGEITQEIVPTPPYHQSQQYSQPSPQVPVIRNHLTHIAAPQPNRVSPLAVAKGPSIELELVNGRPEVVRKQQHVQQYPHVIQSRASTASPANGGGPGSSKKKRREKKRKRESEPSGRGKRKRDKQNAAQMPTSPMYQEQPRIKDEPVSPPPFGSISSIQPYAQQPQYTYQPAEVDLVSPRHAQPQVVYANEPPRSALRYEYPPPASPAVIRVSSPAPVRAVQRDKQDLRRVASLHNLHRPPSPTRVYSPAPHRTASMSYADSRSQTMQTAEPGLVQYHERPAQDNVRYVRADRSQSPPRLQQYHDPYTRVQSPGIMAPPAAPPRKIVVDQYGNQYYAAEPVPVSAQVPRASVGPVDRRPPLEHGYDRAPSRVGTAYGQAPAALQYEQSDVRMAPPPVPRRQTAESQQIQYVDSNGYRVRDYDMRPMEQQIRYVDAPTSPVYQQTPRYEQMAPPSAPSREPTSPVYAPTRSYSVRPEEMAPPQPIAYTSRQANVAPVQYVRQEAPPAPARAMSVAPGFEQPTASYARAYSQAPQPVQYVDQYGRPVFAGDVRQVPQVPRYQ